MKSFLNSTFRRRFHVLMVVGVFGNEFLITEYVRIANVYMNILTCTVLIKNTKNKSCRNNSPSKTSI